MKIRSEAEYEEAIFEMMQRRNITHKQAKELLKQTKLGGKDERSNNPRHENSSGPTKP